MQLLMGVQAADQNISPRYWERQRCSFALSRWPLENILMYLLPALQWNNYILLTFKFRAFYGLFHWDFATEHIMETAEFPFNQNQI